MFSRWRVQPLSPMEQQAGPSRRSATFSAQCVGVGNELESVRLMSVRDSVERSCSIDKHLVVTITSQPASFFEVAIGHEVFGPRPGISGWRYDHRLCARDASTSVVGGPLLVTQGGLEVAETADTVIVAGGDSAGPADPQIVAVVRRAHERGARVMSFCTGAFILAEAGLLDGMEATTHHRFAALLQQRFPKVRVNADVLFIDHGSIATSAGTTAGIDLALHVVRRDLGADAARMVAQDMVLSTQRAGHQAQRVESGARPLVDGDPIAPLLDWLIEHLDERISIGDMARRVAMSERTFARRFKEATGTTPVRWITHKRGARALQLLETTKISIDEIALLTGFSSTAKLREQVRAHTEMSPTEYRRSMTERLTGATPTDRKTRRPQPVYGDVVPYTTPARNTGPDEQSRSVPATEPFERSAS